MCCPSCGNPVFYVRFDYGVCRETGYHDAGETPHCEVHGRLDEGDLLDATQVAELASLFDGERDAVESAGGVE
jgi:hypothetical protein